MTGRHALPYDRHADVVGWMTDRLTIRAAPAHLADPDIPCAAPSAHDRTEMCPNPAHPDNPDRLCDEHAARGARAR